MAQLNRNNSNWSFEERRKINENWEILERVSNQTASGNSQINSDLAELKSENTRNRNALNAVDQRAAQARSTADNALILSASAISNSTGALGVANSVNGVALSAKNSSEQALEIARQAENAAANVQSQLDRVVSEGDSNPEVIQARGDNDSLRARLDGEYTQLNTDITETTLQVTENVKSAPQPMTADAKKSTAKLVIFNPTNNIINVLQSNGKDYVYYELSSAPGTAAQSVGVNWDLIRFRKAINVNDVYVCKSQFDRASVVGTLGVTYEPAARNTFEDYMIASNIYESRANFISSSGDGFGVGVNHVFSNTEPSQVTYKVKTGTNGKANVVLFGTTTSSTSVDILVNGVVVKNVNTRNFALGVNLTFKLIELDIPSRVNLLTDVNITLRNNNLNNERMHFACANFYHLKEYDGQDVDFYKCFNTSTTWIDNAGASDYAIFDHDLQQWCGSYHGGETRISAMATWSDVSTWSPTIQYQTGRTIFREKTEIPNGWYLMPSFKVQQVTNINNKGKMTSMLDFDTDGTIQMSFGFNEGTINVETFYTGLATSHVGMNYVRYPKYEQLPPAPQSVYIEGNEGHVIQRNSMRNISIGHRFTLFGDRYVRNKRKRNGWIYNSDTLYRKFYYGYAEEYIDGVLVKNLQFKKALDFISE